MRSTRRAAARHPGAPGPDTFFPLAWSLALALLWVTPAAAQGVAPPALTARLNELLGRLPQATQVGLVVAEAGSGDVWFAHQADTPLKPASVQKLLVSAAALECFGPAFTYQTRVYAHGDELWVVGAGDPGLGDERIASRHGRDANHVFEEWAAALRARGVTALAKVVLDDSIYDDEYRHPDWPEGQADRWYQAPVGGLNVNDNCVDVSVVVRGKRIDIRSQPDLPPTLFRDGLKVGRPARPRIKRRPDSDVFELLGTVASSTTLDPVAARDPTLFFAHALKQALEKRGVGIRGAVVRRRLTEAELTAATLLVTHSTTLTDVLWRCNVFSQNLFAECLFKSLAAYTPDGRRSDTPGSWSAGRAVLTATLAELGVDLGGAVMRDGSGLSHENRISAAQIVKLLVRMRRHRHADAFRASLAQPGEPGSMNQRYDDPLLRGRLCGKTGTIAGARTLAGYLTQPDGTVLALAVLVNGPGGGDLPLELCRILASADDADTH